MRSTADIFFPFLSQMDVRSFQARDLFLIVIDQLIKGAERLHAMRTASTTTRSDPLPYK